jgi:hypothetical protein
LEKVSGVARLIAQQCFIVSREGGESELNGFFSRATDMGFHMHNVH